MVTLLIEDYVADTSVSLAMLRQAGENPTGQRALEAHLEGALKMLDEAALQIRQLRELLACALDESETTRGISIDPADPHWSSGARRMLENGVQPPDEAPGALERLIDGMCLTFRHDFGLLHEDEKAGLRSSMRQLFVHDIEPFVAGLRGMPAGLPTEHVLRVLELVAGGSPVVAAEGRFIAVDNPSRGEHGSSPRLVIDVGLLKAHARRHGL